MPKTALTDVILKNIKPPIKGQVTHWDKRLCGFGLRVSQGGTKTFVVMVGSTRKRVTVGRYPLLSLADARKRAREILLKAAVREEEQPVISFDEAVERYIRQKEAELKESTWWSYKTLIE